MAPLELNRPEAIPARVVVLGASNVSRGLARLTAIVRARAAGPVQLFVAAGHGRSYGVNSRVAVRRLPSILGSGIWRALDRGGDPEDRKRTVALVTDIGNDLLYGFSVDQVTRWVSESLRRLGERAGTVVVTSLPLASVSGVGAFRYRALRTCYVPGCRLSRAELKTAAAELDARVRGIAAEHSVAVIEQPGEWYGFDAIHLRRHRLDDLWHRGCDLWGWGAAGPVPPPTYAEWLAIGSRAAEVRSLVRRMLFTPQPVIDRPDSFQLSLY